MYEQRDTESPRMITEIEATGVQLKPKIYIEWSIDLMGRLFDQVKNPCKHFKLSHNHISGVFLFWGIFNILSSIYHTQPEKNSGAWLDHSHLKNDISNNKSDLDHCRSDYNHFKRYLCHYKISVITSSVVKITFIVIDITFKEAVITSSVANITFVVTEMTLK